MRTNHPTLYAYVGEDEFGSGEVGLKQGVAPAGIIPLVSIHLNKLNRADFIAQMQAQADTFGKTIRLVRYEATTEVLVLTPRR